jgi:hypothetical protein
MQKARGEELSDTVQNRCVAITVGGCHRHAIAAASAGGIDEAEITATALDKAFNNVSVDKGRSPRNCGLNSASEAKGSWAKCSATQARSTAFRLACSPAPQPSVRAEMLGIRRHFQPGILHPLHVSTGADGFNLLVSRNQWRFPLISLR